jgi:hypothetical protein
MTQTNEKKRVYKGNFILCLRTQPELTSVFSLIVWLVVAREH